MTIQELLVFTIAGVALLYLAIRLFGKNKNHDCDKCNLSDTNESRKSN